MAEGEALTCRSAGARGTWGNGLAIKIALLPEHEEETTDRLDLNRQVRPYSLKG